MIQAVTNRQVGLKYASSVSVDFQRVAEHFFSVITELVVGFMLPGLLFFFPSDYAS